MVKLIDEHREELIDLCRKYYVKKLEVFGSAATGEFGQSSDIDFLVEFDSEANPHRFDNFYFIRQVNQTRRQIYASA
ncbi:MAG: nucleotidyltransferase domain-containing protein [Candidatus Woesebacteria bacterium]|nr:nucleotidyltransferase domain-containing protein [Candidatus Woesebacteria bacterium]